MFKGHTRRAKMCHPVFVSAFIFPVSETETQVAAAATVAAWLRLQE